MNAIDKMTPEKPSPAELETKIKALECKLEKSSYLPRFRETVEEKLKNHVAVQPKNCGKFVTFPANDEDALGLFEDSALTGVKQVELNRERLLESLKNLRNQCRASVDELHALLNAQAAFRPIRFEERQMRTSFVVTMFVEAREAVMQKHESFVANLRAIDSSMKRRKSSLPANANKILRIWLFEHFLNPYPTEAEKKKLCKEAGLTITQINNWFINARVRVWKPTIEAHKFDKKRELPSGSTEPGKAPKALRLLPAAPEPRPAGGPSTSSVLPAAENGANIDVSSELAAAVKARAGQRAAGDEKPELQSAKALFDPRSRAASTDDFDKIWVDRMSNMQSFFDANFMNHESG